MPATLKINGLDAISPGGALATILGQQVFPRAAQAVSRGLEQARSHAIDLAESRMKNPSGAWQGGLRIVRLGPFMGKLISTSPIHGIVEDGHDEINQRNMLNRSAKVRISAQGYRYMYIPFRHKADEVPQNVKDFLKDEGSEITEIFLEKSQQEGIDAMVSRFRYQWGGRAQKGNYENLTKNQEGLVRFGRQGHHQYLTFRVISDNPVSKNPKGPARWKIDAFSGYKIFKDTELFMAGSGVLDQIRDALAADIRSVVGGK
mgnify:CR=1 FL=1